MLPPVLNCPAMHCSPAAVVDPTMHPKPAAAVQPTHDDWFVVSLYCPAGHSVHAAAPPVLYFPAGHTVPAAMVELPCITLSK
jgi:hypothetical protein